MSLTAALAVVELDRSRFYDWKRRFGQDNMHNGLIPKASWILPEERKAIIDYYLANPLNGCTRLSYMMIDEDIAYVSHNTVYRVLKSEGLLESQNGKPSLKGSGFDQPTGPHEQWHVDISYINAGGTFYYQCTILDGFSRFAVYHELAESMTQEKIQIIVQKAKEITGADKVRLISDNGPQFKAREFKSFIKSAGMGQTFTSPYYPQSNGKIERWHKELKSSCIRVKQPRNLEEAKRFVADFIEVYNYKRLHSAIGYVTPYDKLLNLDDELKSQRKEKLARAKEIRKNRWKAIDTASRLANIA
jgi:transposase InsO family protein